jgi:hypothetical protein
MKAFRTILLLAAMATGLVLVSGCATTNGDNVSSIPWDRPQQWEGSGALGGFQGPGGLGH